MSTWEKHENGLAGLAAGLHQVQPKLLEAAAGDACATGLTQLAAADDTVTDEARAQHAHRHVTGVSIATASIQHGHHTVNTMTKV